MTFRELKCVELGSTSDKEIGMTPANNFTKVANLTSGNSQLNLALPLSLTSSSARLSKSKVLKRLAIHLIRFCLKSGITENKNIIKFLEENEIFLTGRTFDRYKSFAEKDLENDLNADIWLSEKVQNSLVPDYKDISDRYDRQLVLDDMLMQSVIKQAIDKSMKFDNDPEKYYRYLDFTELMKIQAISNYTMKNKLELISKGFLVYKIKQHIEYLREQLNQKENKKESTEWNLDFSSLTPKSNINSSAQEIRHSNNNEPENEEYDQEYLDRNDLAIGMNGQPIKKYLADIEKKLGHSLSSI